MLIIKQLKIDNQIIQNIDLDLKNDDDSYIYEDLRDLNTLKEKATDTFNWEIGILVKKSSGGKQVDLSTSNSKAITLLTKLIASLNPSLDNLTDLEKDNYNLLLNLANTGYSDSQKLKNSLEAVVENISKYTDKIVRVEKSDTIEEIVSILSEE